MGRALPLRVGAPLDDEAGGNAVRSVESYYRNRGFLAVSVATRSVSEAGGLVLTLSVSEGPRYALESVRFRGLRGVSEKLALRESELALGEPHDPRSVFRAQSRLYETRLFEDIAARVSTTAPAAVELAFSVTERRPKWLRVGVGYGSDERQRASVAVTHFNFLGRGYKLEAASSLSAIWLEHRVDFQNRHFLGTRTEQTLQGSWRREDRPGYDFEQTLGRFGLARSLVANWVGSVYYRLERIVSYNLDPEIALTTPDETLSGTLGVGMTRDSSDDYFFPRRGTRVGAMLERTGFGGNLHLVKATWDGSAYHPLWGPFVGAASARMGAMSPTDSTPHIPVHARFFTGGANSVRGYRERGVGPTDSLGSPTGGRYLAGGRFELRVPLFWRLNAAAFIDGGQVGDEIRLLRAGLWKAGGGGGLRLRTPVGPLRIDAAYKLNPDDGDRDLWRLHLSVGEAF